MKQVKCANCGRMQIVSKMLESQAKDLTPFERRRHRWFYLEELDAVLCGGSLRTDGVDDGRDWCLHLHRENNPDLYRRHFVMEIFLPGLNGKVPDRAKRHLEEVNGSKDAGANDQSA